MNAVKQERYENILKEFREIDENGDNQLTFQEVFNFMKKKSNGEFSEQMCKDLFSSMDRDNDQEVSTKEFILTYIEAEEMLNQRILELKKFISDNIFLQEDYKKKLLKAKKDQVLQSNNIMVDSVLTVTVIEGMNIRVPNIIPYIELICEKQIIETNPQPWDINPVFKECFTFRIQSGTDELQVILKDSKTNKIFGKGYYTLEDLRDQMKKDVLVDLIDVRSSAPTGRAHLELQWIYNKVKYFEVITEQITDEICEAKGELTRYEDSLVKLIQPFGFLEVKGSLIHDSDKFLSKKVENMAYGIIGRNIQWKLLISGFLASYVLVSVVHMFVVPDFLNPCAAIYGILQSTKRMPLFSYKGFATFLSLLIIYDLLWLFISGRAYPRNDLIFQYFGVVLTLILVAIKVPLAAISFKFGVDGAPV
ncbi:hypothetical protein SteCoe_34118 [Stentor coeruleus]|uniref:EF-hand domain-containing protein n=1 Tax=Stentor coeruleus TaxID=5963 RepID=A0A1R2AV98_9CILI|nr:hypothetical protein SteCoe_34118 [Stentor coeruleus]